MPLGAVTYDFHGFVVPNRDNLIDGVRHTSIMTHPSAAWHPCLYQFVWWRGTLSDMRLNKRDGVLLRRIVPSSVPHREVRIGNGEAAASPRPFYKHRR